MFRVIERGASLQRSYPSRLPVIEHPGPGHFRVKTMTTPGAFRFGKRIVYRANTFIVHRLGMEETDDGL